MNPLPRSSTFLRRAVKWTALIGAVLVGLVGLTLAYFSWQTNRRETKSVTAAAPAGGRFVTAHNTRIFLQEAGPASGPPVLLIHGTGSWSEIWRETMTALARAGFHAIAIDLPPFGYSEKPNGAAEYRTQNQAKRIIGVLDALDLNHAIVVAHSVGARTALEAALQSPTRMTKLVLVDPALGFQARAEDAAHFEPNHPSWMTRTLFSSRRLRHAVLSTYGTNPMFTRSLFASFVSQKAAVTEPTVRMLQQPMVVENTTNAYGDWLEVLTVLPETSQCADFANFKNLKMPVFIIWGATDGVTPIWQADQLQKLIPGSAVSVIPDVGHIPYLENAPDFNRVLLQALSK